MITVLKAKKRNKYKTKRKKNFDLKRFFLFNFIAHQWDNLWWSYHSGNDVYGPGSWYYKKFKTANLAVVISLITLLLVITYILINI